MDRSEIVDKLSAKLIMSAKARHTIAEVLVTIVDDCYIQGNNGNPEEEKKEFWDTILCGYGLSLDLEGEGLNEALKMIFKDYLDRAN